VLWGWIRPAESSEPEKYPFGQGKTVRLS